MSENSKKEKQRPGRGARRSRGEKRKKKNRKKGRKLRGAEYSAACWRVRINKPLC